jgi:phenylalanyl-tRNA synthetase beta chain
MKVSYNWLKDYLPNKVDINSLSETLTNTGLEVSGVSRVEQVNGSLEGLVVGKVTEVTAHPNADRLRLTKVDLGADGIKNIVCGADNVAFGQKVVVATVGCTIYPINAEPLTIKKGKIRGEVSEGMICAEDEIGMGSSHDGIMVLKDKAEVGMPLRDYFQIEEDYSIEIDLTPNRTDAISHFGVARDYLAVQNHRANQESNLNIPSVESFKVDNTDLPISVEIKDRDACPRYSAVSMSGIKVGPSPDWLQMRLKAVGLNPINNVVDAANFVMYETGQPMHVFNADAIKGNKVVIRKSVDKDKFKTLDEQEREMNSADLMICNAEEAMCIAGVFGGFESGVKDDTQRIFIESAYFDAAGIRKTAKRHGLSTDASYRYERGGNVNITIYALKRLALLLKKVAGGKVSSEIVDEYPKKIEQKEVWMRWSYLNKLAGKDISRTEVRNILQSLGFIFITETNEQIHLRVPYYRVDVTREADVVEEVLRIYGYNNIEIPDRMQSSVSFRPEINSDKIRNKVSDFLSARAFREIMNNSLTSGSLYKENSDLVQIMNPLSQELNVMRKSLLEGGLSTLSFNINRNNANLKLYEFGNIYWKSGHLGFEEEMKLGMWITGKNVKESWDVNQRDSQFFDLKKDLQGVFKQLSLDVGDMKVGEYDSPDFKYALSYRLNNVLFAVLGEVSDERKKAFDLDQSVFYVELDWKTALKVNASVNVEFEPLPKYPSVRRDLALLIDKTVSYEAIEDIARSTEKKILREVNLFDVYQGKGIDPDKKSYAVSFVFRDVNRTLTDKHVDNIMSKILKRLEGELNASLR